jgi:hypothetical protein
MLGFKRFAHAAISVSGANPSARSRKVNLTYRSLLLDDAHSASREEDNASEERGVRDN